MSRLLFRSSDPTNNVIADTTLHRIDIPSTHPFNSGCLEYTENGTITEFATSDNTTDYNNRWEITVPAGDTMRVKTRQRVRYVPGYEIEAGLSWFLSNPLPDGAELRIKHANTNDGYIERRTNTQSSLIVQRDGTNVTTIDFDSPVGCCQPQTTIFRNSFEVGSTILYKYYLDEDYNTVFDEMVRAGDLDNISTGNFNLPLEVELDCSNATEPATVNIASMYSKKRGSANRIDREKEFTLFDLGGDINSTTWTPILALRKALDKENITMDLSEIVGIPTDRMKVIAFAVRPDQTDATDFATPEETTPENDAIEITTNITTPTTPEDGRQAAEILANASNVNKADVGREQTVTPIYDDDVIVFLAKTKDVSNASIDLAVKTLQEW